MSSKNKRLKESKELFDEIISQTPFLLENLKETLLNTKKFKDIRLDFQLNDDGEYHNGENTFSFDNLNSIERFFIDFIKGKKYTRNLGKSFMEAAVMVFYAEAVFFHVGGEWEFCMDENDIGFGQPVIVNWGDGTQGNIGPLSMIEFLKEKKKKGKMVDSLSFFLNPEDELDKIISQMKKAVKGNKN